MGYSFCMPDLLGLQRSLINIIHQAVSESISLLFVGAIRVPIIVFFRLPQKAKHKRINILRSLMSAFDATTALIGNSGTFSIDAGIEMMNNKELCQVAMQTKSSYLLHHAT